MRGLSCALLVGLVVIGAGLDSEARAEEAQADEAPGADEAQELLEEGVRLFTEEARYEDARKLFLRSYQLRPSWKALNGVALTYQEQGRYLQALQVYEQLLVEFGSELSPEQQQVMHNRLAWLRARVGVLVLSTDQAGVRILVDGVEVGSGPLTLEVPLMPGTHAVVAELAGHRPLTLSVEVQAGVREPVAISLEPERERVVVKVAPAHLERPMPVWVPWATLGGGVALAGIGGLFTASAAGDFAEFDRQVADQVGGEPVPVSGDRSLRESGELKRDLATGFYVAGGLAVATGVVLLVVNGPRPVKDATIAPSAGGLSLSWSF